MLSQNSWCSPYNLVITSFLLFSHLRCTFSALKILSKTILFHISNLSIYALFATINFRLYNWSKCKCISYALGLVLLPYMSGAFFARFIHINCAASSSSLYSRTNVTPISFIGRILLDISSKHCFHLDLIPYYIAFLFLTKHWSLLESFLDGLGWVELD